MPTTPTASATALILGATTAVGIFILHRGRVRRRRLLPPREATAKVAPADDATAHTVLLGTLIVGGIVVMRSPLAHATAANWWRTVSSASHSLGEGLRSLQTYVRSDVILGAMLLSGARTVIFAVRYTQQVFVHRARAVLYTRVMLESNEVACLSAWLRQQSASGRV